MDAMAQLPLPAGLGAGTFPAKLWSLANDPRVLSVRWDSEARGLLIDRSLFERELLRPGGAQGPAPHAFRATQFRSFVRQLNRYGFRKLPYSVGIGEPVIHECLEAIKATYSNCPRSEGHPLPEILRPGPPMEAAVSSVKACWGGQKLSLPELPKCKSRTGPSAPHAPAGSAGCAASTASSSAQNAPAQEEPPALDLGLEIEKMIREIRNSLPVKAPSAQGNINVAPESPREDPVNRAAAEEASSGTRAAGRVPQSPRSLGYRISQKKAQMVKQTVIYLGFERFLKYQTVLVEQDDVEIVVTNTVNPASFLSGNMGEPVIHECLEAIKATYSSCPDLKDTLLRILRPGPPMEAAVSSVEGMLGPAAALHHCSPITPGLFHLSVKKFLLKLRKNSSRNASLPFFTCQQKTFLKLGQPLPTGLEELEAFSSTQKVLWWLETHVPSDSGSLAKEDEDWGNKVDKEHAQEILEEDSTGPVSSERQEDSSQKQESRDTAKEDSGQEMFQRQENEKPAARGEGISKLQNTSPALAASMDTKDKAGTSPGGAGACLLPSEPPGDRSPSLAATHAPEQPQPQSLFRRALRAVRRAFLGSCHPRRRQHPCPAPSARQGPGDGCSEPQQCP
ncbi:hypothetical protein DUI87_31662 [Hirundo rustica rustica]|uniref:HSF-type DNA-binding domain-containing protein n=1 Tax=Hirundo rustica rustica TaxID=333673 RepID=A0A3M0IUM7_HIRRU|nr:hypothetical protein DUI87_31662 [Hirundo rustica rustica]